MVDARFREKIVVVFREESSWQSVIICKWCTSDIYAQDLPSLQFPALIVFQSVSVLSWGINDFPNFKFLPRTKRRTPLATLSRFPWKLFRRITFSVSQLLTFTAETRHTEHVVGNHFHAFRITLLKCMLHSNSFFSANRCSWNLKFLLPLFLQTYLCQI